MANFKEDILQITTRLIVEEGFDYAHAKQKAGSMLAPNKRRKTKFNSFPTNLEIEKSVKNYLEMFYWEDLNLRIDILQEKAKNLMVELEDFAPILIGELSKDIATEYTIVQLCVFSDSSKDILMHFLDMNHSTEILQLPITIPSIRFCALVVIHFAWPTHWEQRNIDPWLVEIRIAPDSGASH